MLVNQCSVGEREGEEDAEKTEAVTAAAEEGPSQPQSPFVLQASHTRQITTHLPVKRQFSAHASSKRCRYSFQCDG